MTHVGTTSGVGKTPRRREMGKSRRSVEDVSEEPHWMQDKRESDCEDEEEALRDQYEEEDPYYGSDGPQEYPEW